MTNFLYGLGYRDLVSFIIERSFKHQLQFKRQPELIYNYKYNSYEVTIFGF